MTARNLIGAKTCSWSQRDIDLFLIQLLCVLNVFLPGQTNGEYAGCAPGLLTIPASAVTPELLWQLQAPLGERAELTIGSHHRN